jgi:hypothetical protein
MVGAVSCGLAASAVVARPAPVAARRTAACASVRCGPGVSVRGGPVALPRRRPVRARNVVTNDRNSSNGPLDTVEIEDCLQVRQRPSRGVEGTKGGENGTPVAFSIFFSKSLLFFGKRILGDLARPPPC